MYKFYEKFYAATINSKAYSKYCIKVFGKDLTQDGFSDINQLNRLIEITRIQNDFLVLDMGCGNGKIAEYISDVTGANLYGIDYSLEAINQAKNRTKKKRSRLSFKQDLIGKLSFPKHFFDLIISIDTIFFGNGIKNNLKQLLPFLKPKGQLAIFFSPFIFECKYDKNKLLADNTSLAEGLKHSKLQYISYDFTQAHYKHMQLKNKIGKSLKNDFTAEGNEFLYDRILTESVDENKSFKSFRQFSTRYLYHVQL
jgi:SAM-dependent methyltransferase